VLHAEEDAGHVHRDHAVPGRQVEVDDAIRPVGDARIVERVVEAPEVLHRGTDHALDRCLVRDVDAQRECISPELLGGLLCVGLVDVGNDDLRATAHQKLRHGVSDAAGAAGDQCHFSIVNAHLGFISSRPSTRRALPPSRAAF
jgi:hypothetical protein